MSPNGISSGFDETFSSDSSDSEFLSQGDLKTRGNRLSKQWEAIERTLYQEPGQQVTDPELLKECKLWRETFPHFRAKGTKIEIKNPAVKVEEADKNIQTLQNHFNLKILEEKRECIKKKVVGVLVERLIAKFGSEKLESAKLERDCSSGVRITEIDDETAEEISNPSPRGLTQAESTHSPTTACTEKESYFERGKPLNRKTWNPEEGLTVEKVEKNLCDIFDYWTQSNNPATKPQNTAESANSKKVTNSRRANLTLRNPVNSNIERSKPRKLNPPFDSLASLAKPFEITKKIDKKYDGLIEKIMERQYKPRTVGTFGLEPRRHCRARSSELEHYQEPLGKLRMTSGVDEHLRKKSLPRLNKFSNPWLDRTCPDSYNNTAGDHVFRKITDKFKRPSESLHAESLGQREIDDRFLEELKREMTLNYKRPPKKSGLIEEINLRRPKPFASTPQITSKSSSFGDLTKRNKKEVRGGPPMRPLEPRPKESVIKSRVESNIFNANRGNKKNGSRNFLPPFDTGIICTELTGIPKIGPKKQSKRY